MSTDYEIALLRLRKAEVGHLADLALLLDAIIDGRAIKDGAIKLVSLQNGTPGLLLGFNEAGEADEATPGAAGGGDMLKATYDSGNKAANVYARANHTGTQAVGTITGLGALATKNTIAAADIDAATITPAKLDREFVEESEIATVAKTGLYSDLGGKPTLGTASAEAATSFASAAQGAKADTAVQPGSLAQVATSGQYVDLTGRPTLGTAADNAEEDFATGAEGDLAATALQPDAGGQTISNYLVGQSGLISGTYAIQQTDAGKDLLFNGTVAAMWDVPVLSAGSVVAIHNIGTATLTLGEAGLTTFLGPTEIPPDKTAAVSWLPSNVAKVVLEASQTVPPDGSVTVAKLATTVRVEELSGHIVTAANKTYVLSQAAAWAGTITSLTIKSASGTCTAKLTIDDVDVTGISAVAVSGTEAVGTASGANTIAIGATIALVISANSAAVDVAFSLKMART